MSEQQDEIPGADADPDEYGRFEKTVGGIAGVALLAMMVLIFVDVIGRYVLGRPISGAYQLGSILLLVLLFGSLPIVVLKEAQLTVGFTDHRFRGRARQIRRLLVNLLGGGLMAVVTWRLWAQGTYFTIYPEILEVLDVPLFVLCYVMSILTGLATVMHLVVAARALRDIGAPQDA